MPRRYQVSDAWMGTLLLLLTGGMLLCAWFGPPGLNWALVMILMLTFLVVLGVGIVGRPLGILINERKIVSLSRFQMVLWTLIIVSGYFVMAVMRVKEGDVSDPLAIGIDWKVWTLLGISAASLVGSPLVASDKKVKQPASKKVVKLAGEAYDETEDQVEAQRVGVLYGNQDVLEARITDMFEGEELVNARLVDIAKVQMFFFTIVIALVYSAELLHMIVVDDILADGVTLPAIHEGLLMLMGLSHAGYLGSKGITQTPTTLAFQPANS